MKIERKKDKDTNNETEINLQTGDVNVNAAPARPEVPTQPEDTKNQKPEAWLPKKRIDFERCVSFVNQIVNRSINIVDEKNILTIAFALASFGEAGRDLFVQVCLHQTLYDSESIQEHFNQALQKSKYNTPVKFINICTTFGLEVLYGDDNYTYFIIEGIRPVNFTDSITEEMVRMIDSYGFIEYRDQYYFATRNREEKRITLESKSNFTMQVLYHINRGKNNKRVIGLKNIRKEQIRLEIETKELNSLQAFKALTEGLGFFTTKDQFNEKDLQKIKNKLFAEEKPSKQLEVLGWDKKGFWAFCNGLYNVGDQKFYAVDEYGIVSLNNVHYHIPFHPGTDEYNYINEKKLMHIPSTIDFNTWASLYAQAFKNPGCTVLAFTIATVFSDHIFGVKNNFPMLFLYGEGGSGKGTVCEFAQYLFGMPQPPLKLTEKANTDKARVRKFATYCNVPVRIEEFSNSIDMSATKTLTNLYDRFGYERSSMETRYGTETVPIRSTVMITGNEYPADDPLMQRLVLLDQDNNKHTSDQIAAFRKLQHINMESITSILTQLLAMRGTVEKHWRIAYQAEYDTFRTECENLDVPSRMVENYAVLLGTYKCMELAGLQWPMLYHDFKAYLKQCLTIQAEKRSTGAVVQRFWDIVLILASKTHGGIHENKEFLLDGESLYIRFKDIHPLYMEEHFRIYRSTGLLQASLLQKLKISTAFIESVPSKRFGKINTSAMKFDYSLLNIDLLYVVNQKRTFRDAEVIETPMEREAREEEERKAKLVRANEINAESVAFHQDKKSDDETPF